MPDILLPVYHFFIDIYRISVSIISVDFKMVFAHMMIFTLLTSNVNASCRRQLTVQIIRYNDCIPKRLLTYSCNGSCSSDSHLSATYPFGITHTCLQCKESIIHDRKVKIKCPNYDGISRFKNIHINIPVPKTCLCQRCD